MRKEKTTRESSHFFIIFPGLLTIRYPSTSWRCKEGPCIWKLPWPQPKIIPNTMNFQHLWQFQTGRIAHILGSKIFWSEHASRKSNGLVCFPLYLIKEALWPCLFIFLTLRALGFHLRYVQKVSNSLCACDQPDRSENLSVLGTGAVSPRSIRPLGSGSGNCVAGQICGLRAGFTNWLAGFICCFNTYA